MLMVKIVPKTQSQLDRERIDAQVTDYLNGGGEIQTVDHTANHSYNQPIKLSKKAFVKEFKRLANKIR